jgi:hypothetical protein
LPALSEADGSLLSSVRFNGVNILGKPKSEAVQLLYTLPALQHLHVYCPARLRPKSFTKAIPPQLCSLTLSEYNPSARTFEEGGAAFIVALAACIAYSAVHGPDIARIAVTCFDELRPIRRQNLEPLGHVCDEQGIDFEQTVRPDHFGRIPIPDFEIFCMMDLLRVPVNIH